MGDSTGARGWSKANQRQNTRHKNKYIRQRYRTSANKKKAWKKHIEIHPNDLVGKKAIEKKLLDLILY